MIIGAFVLLALVLSASAFAMYKKNEKLPSQNGSGSTTTPKLDGTNKAQPATTNPGSQNNTPVTTPTATNNATVSITNFSEDATQVHVRAIVNNASTGMCELELSKEGVSSVKKSTEIVPNTNYYSCGFDVPKGEIPESGTWTASVKVKDSSADATTAKLIINK